MREIKFRAWVDSGDDNFYMVYQKGSDIECDIEVEDLRSLIFDYGDSTLMQYTGLKDKNGKEIYEGDIIKHYKYNKGTYKVVYTIENTGYDLVCGNNKTGMHLCSDCQPNLGVIGNIYENPELLEVKNG